MKEGYIGLDIGGTGVKAGFIDRHGKMIGFASRKINPVCYSDGRVEIPVTEIYNAAKQAVREAAGANAKVLSLSVSSQGQTFVSIDKKGRPLHNAVIWYDSRAGEQAAALGNILKQYRASCPAPKGTPPDLQAVSTIPKIKWYQQKYPAIMRRADKYLLLPDYFSFMFTGTAVIDPCMAGTTGRYVSADLRHDKAFLNMAGFDEKSFAEIRETGEPVGVIRPAVAAQWGLRADTLYVNGTNDQFAGALGAGNCRPGILTETSGTCLAIVGLLKKLPASIPVGLLAGDFPVKKLSFLLAYSKTAGVVLDWFRRELCGDISLEQICGESAAVPAGSCGVNFIPHFDGAFSPVPDPAMRGAVAGLSLQTTRAVIYRAILESLAYVLRENVELLGRYGCKANSIRSIGGGAKDALWLQIKADVTGLPVEQPCVTEAAALGAAMIAAAGRGDFKSITEASMAFYKARKIFKPDRRLHQIYTDSYNRYLALKKL